MFPLAVAQRQTGREAVRERGGGKEKKRKASTNTQPTPMTARGTGV